MTNNLLTPRSSAISLPEVCYKSPRLCTGCWRNVFVILWRGQPQPEDVGILSREYRSMAQRSPDPLVVWVIIEDKVPAPEDHVRKGITSPMDAMASRIAASVGVLESQGFVAAATRGALTAMSLLIRGSYPRKFFPSVAEGAAWSSTWTLDTSNRPIRPPIIIEQIQRLRAMVA